MPKNACFGLIFSTTVYKAKKFLLGSFFMLELRLEKKLRIFFFLGVFQLERATERVSTALSNRPIAVVGFASINKPETKVFSHTMWS